MAHHPETRTALRGAYVHQCLPLSEAARRVGVSEGTATNWKRKAREAGDDWDRARAASLSSGRGQDTVLQDVLERIVMLTQSTLEALQDADVDPLARVEAISRLSDAYHKTASAAAKTNPKLSKLAVAMEVLERLAAYTGQHYPQHLAGLVEVLEPFGAELARSMS